MTRRSTKTRVIRIEGLEPRLAMNAAGTVYLAPDTGREYLLPKSPTIAPQPISVRHFASSNRVDVNQDNQFSSLDTLTIVNALARSTDSTERHDINGDGRVSALDALLLINELQRAGDQAPLLPASNGDVESQRKDAINFVSNISSAPLPDGELVDVVAHDFARISASYPDLEILVSAPSPGSVFVLLTPDDVAAYDAGEFHRLDDLNAELEIDSITRNDSWGHSDFSGLIITFKEPYRWDYLQERYAAIDGIRDAFTTEGFWIGRPYGIRLESPSEDDGSRTYNFQFGSGACPTGCLNVHIVSVRVTDVSVERYEKSPYIITHLSTPPVTPNP